MCHHSQQYWHSMMLLPQVHAPVGGPEAGAGVVVCFKKDMKRNFALCCLKCQAPAVVTVGCCGTPGEEVLHRVAGRGNMTVVGRRQNGLPISTSVCPCPPCVPDQHPPFSNLATLTCCQLWPPGALSPSIWETPSGKPWSHSGRRNVQVERTQVPMGRMCGP